MSKPIISVDFDGTVHSYEKGWQDGSIYGTVTPGFFAWLVRVVEAGYDVQIYSTRSATPEGVAAMTEWLQTAYADWAEQDDERPRVMPLSFPTTKPRAIVSIDDRALTFMGRWDDFYPDTLKIFQPWTMTNNEELAMTKPDDVNPEHIMHTIIDEPGRKLIERLFKTYVQDEHLHARLPAFMLGVDRLVAQMGGRPVDQDQKAKEDAEREKNKKDGGKSDDKDGDDKDDDYEDDEDIHAEKAADLEADKVRIAVASMLTNNGG